MRKLAERFDAEMARGKRTLWDQLKLETLEERYAMATPVPAPRGVESDKQVQSHLHGLKLQHGRKVDETTPIKCSRSGEADHR